MILYIRESRVHFFQGASVEKRNLGRIYWARNRWSIREFDDADWPITRPLHLIPFSFPV